MFVRQKGIRALLLEENKASVVYSSLTTVSYIHLITTFFDDAQTL